MLSFMMLRSTIGEAKAYGALKALTGHIQENCMDCRPHLTTSWIHRSHSVHLGATLRCVRELVAFICPNLRSFTYTTVV
jgi:hypothetical protein